MRARSGGLFSAAVLSLASLLGLAAPPAAAITSYNSSPAPELTAVGALIVDTGAGRRWTCSGTMIDADTFLTAAHCLAGQPEGTRYYVSLAQTIDAIALAAAVPGTAIADPAYPGPASDRHDLAVIELGAAAGALGSFAPALLPPLGLLATEDRRTRDAGSWLVAGYGINELQRGPGGLSYSGGGTRLKAPVGFNALNATWVRLSQNRAKGEGGACYGDSGGPNFLTVSGTQYLVSTTITGDTPCYATNVTYRLDTSGARAFLAPYVDLF